MKTPRVLLWCMIGAGVCSFTMPTSARKQAEFPKKVSESSDRMDEPATPSGLEALFPENARCFKISSPFGSSTRYDGSPRPSWAPGGGTHGGIDISLDEGTPLLALASGTLMSKGEGGQMVGNYIWLRHAPEDTGLPYWVFTKYQHLKTLPELPVNSKVLIGQVIAYSGKTGTLGGHYGAAGYAHLHFTTRKSPDGEFQGSTLFDPLVLFQAAGIAGQESSRAVIIPYMTDDGSLFPQATRIIWPIACRAQ